MTVHPNLVQWKRQLLNNKVIAHKNNDKRTTERAREGMHAYKTTTFLHEEMIAGCKNP
jgi:hypothetical protein